MKKFDRREQIKPIIFGVSGKVATADELELFNQHNPLGFIIFGRNIEEPEQLKRLIQQLKATIFPRNDVLVLIDQEGGRVARLKPPFWNEMPPAKYFGDMIEPETLARAKRSVYNHFRLCSYELKQLGINVNCAPTLDLYFDGAHDIIGDRAYSSDPYEVAELAKEVCRGLLMGNVFPVIKHIPGHGRAKSDSHLELPVVDVGLQSLRSMDFAPFKALSDMPFAMTAHIKYTAIDPIDCATYSSKVINLIRNEIGFKGLIMSDDLTMKALEGSMATRAHKALNAGCDIVLHCNGDINEMKEICESVDFWNKEHREKFRNCWKALRY
ncbi:MAG: beta-N-acetylhexosaminidase [Rickettsiales bacterium]|nr:beta-N-acetylhexosaminidase [Rickettsiales bacterium]